MTRRDKLLSFVLLAAVALVCTWAVLFYETMPIALAAPMGGFAAATGTTAIWVLAYKVPPASAPAGVGDDRLRVLFEDVARLRTQTEKLQRDLERALEIPPRPSQEGAGRNHPEPATG